MNRFQEQNEVIVDTQTGLMGTKNGSLSEFPMTWSEASAFVKELNDSKLYSYGDWKIPNRREFFSLISHQTINPSLPWHEPRFREHVDCFYDNAAELTWLKDANANGGMVDWRGHFLW